MVDLSLKEQGSRTKDQAEVGQIIAVMVPVLTVLLFLTEVLL